MIIVYITCRDEKEAKKISTHLLKKRLIACANIFPVKSLYWWKNKITEENEYVIIAKSKREKFKNIKEQTKNIHSYDVPCIECWDVADVDKEYLQWIKDETR